MASIKRPKLRKLPKKPKANASIETFKRYEQRAKDVISHNSDKVNEYNKKVSDKASVVKKKTSIVSGIGSLHTKVKSKLK